MQGGEDRVAAGVSPASERTQPTVATAREDTPQGYSCGCQSCYSSSPTTKVAVTPAPATPDAPVAALATLFGIARQPLVPPPQRAL